MNNNLILQVNVPLCVRRCAYCHQNICKYDPDLGRAYAKALLTEIESTAEDMRDYTVRAVSIEGGSPALLEAGDLQAILRSIKRNYTLSGDAQISLQTMPGDYSRALMEKMRDNGVNFWIIGLVTADFAEHELLRRPYRFDALTMVDLALKTFSPRALSFDLLYGIPGQTWGSFAHSIETALSYAPDHMTLWPMNLTGNSAMQVEAEAGLLTPMPKEEMRALYDEAARLLAERGYRAYSRMDFCRPGKEYVFRRMQMDGAAQLGLGYRAVTIMDGYTYTNGHSLTEYLSHAGELEVLANGVTALEGAALKAWEKAREEMRACST